MKKQKVFVIFSHLAYDTEYEILLATTDAAKVLEKWIELGLNDDNIARQGFALKGLSAHDCGIEGWQICHEILYFN